MSSTSCEKFARNAWKKELCSNCFKAKDEHVEKNPKAAVTHFQALPEPPKEGILKMKNVTRRELKKVAFSSSEFEVIGFGGDNIYSDDDDDDEDVSDGDGIGVAELTDTDEDKALQKLTKTNTDFNSVAGNLLGATTPVEPLRLGKQVIGDNGAKKTLLVPVTPFGGWATGGAKSNNSVRDSSLKTSKLNCETTSLVENIVKTEIELETTLAGKVSEIGIRRSQPLDKNFKYKLNKDSTDDKGVGLQFESAAVDAAPTSKLNERLTTSTKVANLLDKAKKKVHNMPVIGDLQQLKAKSIESKRNDANKCVVLDMYDIKDVSQFRIIEDSCDGGSAESNQPILPQPNTKKALVLKDTKDNCSNEENAQYKSYNASCDILDNFEGILDGEEITVFSMGEANVCENESVIVRFEPICEIERSAPDGKDERDSPLPCEIDGAGDNTQLPPALPLSPPPTVDPRVSFLHQFTASSHSRPLEKPKLPAKPAVIPAKRHPLPALPPRPISPSKESFLDDPRTCSPQPVLPLSVGEGLNDSGKKRPAPQPPSPSTGVSPTLRTFSSDNLLKLPRNGFSTTPHVRSDVSHVINRRTFSLSQDSLLDSGVRSNEIQSKKKHSRGRFSLRKFLHFGKNKEGSKENEPREYRIESSPASPGDFSSRPRLKPEIIHPVELTRLQLLPQQSQRLANKRRSSSSASSSSEERQELDLSDSSTTQSVSSCTNSEHAALSDQKIKPLPPPRTLHLDSGDKPVRPPPPKGNGYTKGESKSLVQNNVNSVYANFGDVSVAPSKPARTGSLREVDLMKKLVPAVGVEDVPVKKTYWTGSLRGTSKCPPIINQPEDSGYESFDVSLVTSDSTPSSHTSSLTNEENLYECLQSEGLSSGNIAGRNTKASGRIDRRSDGYMRTADGDYSKFRFLRSASIPHCVAEMDSDIYSPYSFCASEMGEEDYEWSPTSGRFQKVSRLKMKKGRSIVHKNLEDNYGAVVIANHEALTQVVQQLHQGPIAPAALRTLISASNLRWSDFTVAKDHGSVTVGQRTFYSALWGLEPVTLCLAPEESVGSLHGKPPFSLQPLTQLHDLVPAFYVSPGSSHDTSLVQCSISVISRIKIDPLESYCRSTAVAPLTEDSQKEIYFVLLLIIHALKTQHQASGIEEVPVGLPNVLVCREERDPHPWICWLPGYNEPTISLCGCLMELLNSLPTTELSPLLETTLRAEKAVSLSQAKALLEFTLWGPADIVFEKKSRGAALQRWLDLERASILHGLVRARSDLSVFEEWHLLFLAHTNAKILNDASILLESQFTATTMNA